MPRSIKGRHQLRLPNKLQAAMLFSCTNYPRDSCAAHTADGHRRPQRDKSPDPRNTPGGGAPPQPQPSPKSPSPRSAKPVRESDSPVKVASSKVTVNESRGRSPRELPAPRTAALVGVSWRCLIRPHRKLQHFWSARWRLGGLPRAVDGRAPYKGGHRIGRPYRVAPLIGCAHPIRSATL